VSGASLLHVSDLHFGVHSLPEQIEKLEALIARGTFDVVAVSGDLTQRARGREFARARSFLADADEHSRTIAVPGNHDIAWWRAPLHVGVPSLIHAKWRRHLGRETDPVLRIPGVTLAGVNTAHGISRRTLTRRPRDLSVIGDLLDVQIERVAHTFSLCEPGERRVVVMHHNPVAGEISGRYGLSHSAYVLDRFAELRVDLVLCGHDHQEAIHFVERERHGIVVSTAGTITTRSRGARPTSVNAIRLSERGIAVRTLVWDAERGDFVAGSERRFGA
jgi:3',5'-cyclic AMP phosphodiesterase CpdA